MKQYIGWHKLSQLLPDISLNIVDQIIASPYYKLADSIFSYLYKNQKQSGAIFDSNMSSTLDFQYHQTHFSLSGIMLYLSNREDKYIIAADKSLKYFGDLPKEVKRGSSDFNNFAILLSYVILFDSEKIENIKEILKDNILEMENYASLERKHTYGNNFITLRALNQLIRFKLMGKREDIEQARYFMYASLKWQFDDGIFYDYPRDLNYSRGIPPLAYNSKIALITLFFGLIDNDDYIINRALLGLNALAKLTSFDGEAFYYGRTNNALYGYACGILALRIASNYIRNTNVSTELLDIFISCEKALFSFCSKNLAKDGHLYIVPNDLEDHRCGFDNYMYVSVYNAFTMSMLLLSSIIKKTTSTSKYNYPSEINYLKESGFIVKKGKYISTAFNLKGHNYYQQYLLDPRYTSCSPLFLKFNGHDILPTIPFSAPICTGSESMSFGRKMLRKLKAALSEYSNWGYLRCFNPLHAGFIPYLEKKNRFLMPLFVSEAIISTAEDMVIVKIHGKFMSVLRRGFLGLAIRINESMRNKPNIYKKRLNDMRVIESDVSFDRTIVIHDYFIHFLDKINGRISENVYFNIRTYADGEIKFKNNQFLYKKEGYGFVLFVERGETLRGHRMLCSSKGKTIYWDLVKKVPDKCNESITLTHTLIPFDKKKNLESSVSLFDSRCSEIDSFISPLSL